MKKRITIVAATVLPLLYIFGSCNTNESRHHNSIPTDSVTIAQGKNSFVEKCNSCHNFSYEGIGPQLAGITSEQSVGWIKNFIRDPKQVIDSGDTTAQKLFKYYKTIMPSFKNLPDEEIN